MARGRMHTPHPTPSLDPSLAISYRNHQESLTYYNHLAPLILFFFLQKTESKWGEGMALHPSPKYAPTLNHQSFLLMPI